MYSTAVVKPMSAKQMSRLRNGHKVRVAPAIQGEGIPLMIDPAKLNQITRSFDKGKGVMLQLSPDEISANREIGGEGIFKTLKSVAKSPITKALVKEGIKFLPPAAQPLASAGADLALKKAAGSGITSMLKKGAKAAAKSGLAKAALKEGIKMLPSEYQGLAGAAGDLALSKAAGKGITSMLKKGAKAAAKSGLAKAALKEGIKMLPSEYQGVAGAAGQLALSQMGGSGLYMGSRGSGISARGSLLNVANSSLPPAMQSQNSSANFHFATQLPPHLAALKGSGLYL